MNISPNKFRCRLCDSLSCLYVDTISFVLPSNIDPEVNEIVICKSCELLQARNVGDFDYLDRYYQVLGNHIHWEIPEGLNNIHDEYIKNILKLFGDKRDIRILDIGCGAGHVLHKLNVNGFTNLFGVDENPQAVKFGRDKYNLNLYDGFEQLDSDMSTKGFDLILLLGVLEHIVDLKIMCKLIKKYKKLGSTLFLSVPDAKSFANNYGEEPLLEINHEHINYFDDTSITFFSTLAGYNGVEIKKSHNTFYNNTYLFASLECTSTEKEINTGGDGCKPYDYVLSETQVGFCRYVSEGKSSLNKVVFSLQNIFSNRDQVIFWGGGALTAKLLPIMVKCNFHISKIIDRNPRLWGLRLSGVLLDSPFEITSEDKNLPVIIISYVYGSEIEQELLTLGWKGEIIKVCDLLSLNNDFSKPD